MNLRVVLYEGSCPNINNILWEQIELIDQVGERTRVMFKPKTKRNGMVEIRLPQIEVNGSRIARGFDDIRNYLKSMQGLSDEIDRHCRDRVGGSIAVAAC